MLGVYPIATTPLAVIVSAGAQNIVEADASTTITATTSWDSLTVLAADASTIITATNAFVSSATAQSDSATTLSTSTAWDSAAFVSAESTSSLAASAAFDSTVTISADSTSTLALSVSFDASAFVLADITSTPVLSTSWDGVARQAIEADFSAAAALSSSWSIDTPTYSAGDMSTTAALSNAFVSSRLIASSASATPSETSSWTSSKIAASTAAYTFGPYLETQYIQTNGSPDFLWAPDGATGIEAVSGKYTFFVKVLGFDTRTTDYWRYMMLYDDTTLLGGQIVDTIMQFAGTNDRLIFGGQKTDGSENWQYAQVSATAAGNEGVQVFAVTIDQGTNKARSMIASQGSTLLNVEVSTALDRSPLHVGLNAQIKNVSGTHTSFGQAGKIKFISAGLLSDSITAADLAKYSVTGDARSVWTSGLHAYWTASTMYDSVTPKLSNLGSSTVPMSMNSLGFGELYTLPEASAAQVSWSSLSFGTTSASATCSLAPSMRDVAIASSVASTIDTGVVTWDGLAIGPVPVDFAAVLAANVMWSGQRLVSTIKEDVRVGRTLTDAVNVGRSITADVQVGE